MSPARSARRPDAVKDIRMLKGETLVEQREREANEDKAHRLKVKRDVWARDKGMCRCCGGPAIEMHELKFRSLGGARCLYNSVAVCTSLGAGANCHRLLQRLLISWRFVSSRLGANGAIEFERDGRVWRSVPGQRIQRDRRSWQRD